MCQTTKSLSPNTAKICLTKFHLTKPLSRWTKCDKVSSRIPKLCLIFPNPSFLINDYAKIQSLKKLQGCCTFRDYACHLFSNILHTTTQVMSHVITTLDSSWLHFLHAPNKQPKGEQSDNLFRALKSNYLEDNKSDLATYLSVELLQNTESLARNGEVVARGGF